MTTIHKARLRDALVTRKIRPAALAALAALDKSVVCRILNAPAEDVPIYSRALFRVAGALHVSAAFLQNKTTTAAPDPVTLEFRLHDLKKRMAEEREKLSQCFPDHAELQKHHAAFECLMEEYLQIRQALAEMRVPQ